jgi:lysophospholipase L1-like esterase
MIRKPAGFLALTVLLAGATLGAQQQRSAASDPNRWEPNMVKFEQEQKLHPFPKNEIVFWGASSIVRWNLPDSFPDLAGKTLNRGFGGSTMGDAARYASRIVVPLAPRVVVLYPGENDIARGVKADTVGTQFEDFLEAIHDPLPQTRIVAIGLKPTPVRWQFESEMLKANALIKAACEKEMNCVYVDVHPEMLGADGKPKPELYVSDGEHMTPEGYEIWNRLVRPHLD